MDGASLTSLLDFDLIGDDPHQLELVTGGRLGLYALAQRVDLRVGQQGLLPAQGGPEFVSQRQPMLARSAGSKEPGEQMVRWRGPAGVVMDSTRR